MKIHIYNSESLHIVKCMFEDYFKLEVPKLYWGDSEETAVAGLLVRNKGVFLENAVEIRKWSKVSAKGDMVLVEKYDYILFEYKEDAMMFKLKFCGTQ